MVEAYNLVVQGVDDVLNLLREQGYDFRNIKLTMVQGDDFEEFRERSWNTRIELAKQGYIYLDEVSEDYVEYEEDDDVEDSVEEKEKWIGIIITCTKEEYMRPKRVVQQ